MQTSSSDVANWFWDIFSGNNLQGRIGLSAVIFLLLATILVARLPGRNRLHVIKVGLIYLGCVLGILGARLLDNSGKLEPARVLRAVAVLIEGLCFIRLSFLLIFKLILPSFHLAPQQILQDIVAAFTSLVWLLARLRIEGLDLASLITTSAVLTAIIGFALQDTLGNILGGLFIELDKTITIGDWVRYDNISGRVMSITWRQTEIETNNWETHVIPNSMLTKQKLVIVGRREGQPRYWRRWIYFNVDFRHSPSEVIRVVTDGLNQCNLACVALDPKPHCILVDFAESYAKYAARYWLADISADDGTDSQVRTHIYFALQRANITLSIPAQSVFLTEESDSRKEQKNAQLIAVHLAVLQKLKLFQSFTEDELRLLAVRLRPAPFAKGDVMIRQGAVAHWLYIIREGTADVVVAGRDGVKKTLSEIGPGSIFGEMGLMTGATREASVIATSDVECYRLDKASFLDIVRQRPAVAEDISKALAQHKTELDTLRENLNSEAQSLRMRHVQADFLTRIRNFFDIADEN